MVAKKPAKAEKKAKAPTDGETTVPAPKDASAPSPAKAGKDRFLMRNSK